MIQGASTPMMLRHQDAGKWFEKTWEEEKGETAEGCQQCTALHYTPDTCREALEPQTKMALPLQVQPRICNSRNESSPSSYS